LEQTWWSLPLSRHQLTQCDHKSKTWNSTNHSNSTKTRQNTSTKHNHLA